MLETPKGKKITTAALAARLEMLRSRALSPLRQQGTDVRGLIEFIEQSLFSVINQITPKKRKVCKQVEHIIGLLLGFAQRNAA